jgi:mono/diheme cytochrome c family protein
MMRTILATLVITFTVVLISGAGAVYSGIYDIGATAPHWRITQWILETVRVRSIKVHAAGITAPPGLDDPARIPMGTEHFAAHCAVCHGAPGVPKGDIAQGLYPQPPDLAVTEGAYSDGELFWILKHGIKMTGMPAWGDHSDGELWATVAFLRKLPGMTEQDYAKLVMQSMHSGGHPHDSDRGEAPPAGASSPGAHPH